LGVRQQVVTQVSTFTQIAHMQMIGLELKEIVVFIGKIMVVVSK
jgi:hypothetical protein